MLGAHNLGGEFYDKISSGGKKKLSILLILTGDLEDRVILDVLGDTLKFSH